MIFTGIYKPHQGLGESSTPPPLPLQQDQNGDPTTWPKWRLWVTNKKWRTNKVAKMASLSPKYKMAVHPRSQNDVCESQKQNGDPTTWPKGPGWEFAHRFSEQIQNGEITIDVYEVSILTLTQ